MATRNIYIYGAYNTIDEYGNHGTLIGWFQTSTRAFVAAMNQGWYGGNGAVVTQPAIQLETGEIYAVVSHSPIKLNVNLIEEKADLKQQALAKLTEEDRKVLGL